MKTEIDGGARSEKRIQRGEAWTENARTPIVIAEGSFDGRSRRGGGKSGESSVNSIRIALVYIRGQDSPRAILPSRISIARRADYVRGRGIDVPLFPEVVLGTIGLPGAWMGPLDSLPVVLDF